jgi:hypothetical protein
MGWVETTIQIGVMTGTSDTTTVVVEGFKGVPLTMKGMGVEGVPIYF